MSEANHPTPDLEVGRLLLAAFAIACLFTPPGKLPSGRQPTTRELLGQIKKRRSHSAEGEP